MKLKLYTVIHDREGCIGCGSCELEAPQTWSMESQDGLSQLKDAREKNGIYLRQIDELDYEDNRRACASCPVQVIQIRDAA